MELPTLHTAHMRVLLTNMASADEPDERVTVGRLADLALMAPGQMTEAEIAALGNAMACHGKGWIVNLRPVRGVH